MKFPFSMLLDFVVTDLSAEAVGDLLTMTGFELEGIEEVEGDKVLDIKVCSNRGDGLSVLGLARELLAKRADAKSTELYERACRRFSRPDEGTDSKLGVPVGIEIDACTRFAYRGFTGVTNAEAPELIRKRLRQAGQRPISLFVDLTNYVMLELGQPLHAYDLDKLKGPEIIVRSAAAGEKITTLNGVDHELKPGQMMICDAGGPIGVAGVMGGGHTEVDASTTRVLLEAAHFVNTSVRRTRNQLGLNTDASYRFERSVDPEGVVGALNRVRELLEDLGHEEWCLDGVSDRYPTPPATRSVRLRLSRAQTLLGMTISDEEARRYLGNLGFAVDGSSESYSVTTPTWRADIHREEDLVEELGRIHGYERIPEWLPAGHLVTSGGLAGRYLAEANLVDAALRAGFDQAMCHSLRGTSPLDDRKRGSIAVRTPGSADTEFLRNTLLSGLAEAARRNGAAGLHLFELGPIFQPPFETRKALALLSVGPLYPANRQKEQVPVADFFSLKQALDAVLLRVGESLRYTPLGDDPRFHPGRCAAIQGAGVEGVAGQIHPLVAEAIGLPAETLLAEIVLNDLNPEPEVAFAPVSRNPAVRRDIAFLIDKTVSFERIRSAIEKSLHPLLEDVWLFDVYEGKGVPEGQHSLGVAFTLRKSDANFTDEEANQVRDAAVAALADLGAIRR